VPRFTASRVRTQNPDRRHFGDDIPPRNKNPASAATERGAIDRHDGQHSDTTPDASGLQARRLHRLFGFAPSTARTIAGLAFPAVSR